MDTLETSVADSYRDFLGEDGLLYAYYVGRLRKLYQAIETDQVYDQLVVMVEPNLVYYIPDLLNMFKVSILDPDNDDFRKKSLRVWFRQEGNMLRSHPYPLEIQDGQVVRIICEQTQNRSDLFPKLLTRQFDFPTDLVHFISEFVQFDLLFCLQLVCRKIDRTPRWILDF